MNLLVRVSQFLRDFPGFWLNVIALLLSAVFVFAGFQGEMRECESKCLTLEERLNAAISDYLAGSRSRFAVADQMRQDIHTLTHSKTEDGLRKHHIEPSIEKFLSDLNIPLVLARVTLATKADELENLTGRFRNFLHDQSALVHNWDIFLIWASVAVLYVGLVGFTYIANAAKPEEAEPLLNIIDIGLLLTLIEYSGGLKSPVLVLLFFSISVACFELSHAIQEHPLSWVRIKMFGVPTALTSYVPSILYLFALLTGLAWASIDDARLNGQSLTAYFLDYASTVTYLFLYALITFMALKLFYSINHRARLDKGVRT